MTDEQKNENLNQPNDEQPAQDADETTSEEPEARAEHDAEDALATIQKERDELEQRMLRIAADYQNYVRRSEQNIVSAREQLLLDVAKSLVTVLDHFDRALEIDPEKASAKDVLDGVNIVRDELLRALERFDIQRLDVKPGDAFDPNHHEALMRQPSDEIESNHVTSQFQPGYVLKDKTVRPAKVCLAE